jgi:hypothetical protein
VALTVESVECVHIWEEYLQLSMEHGLEKIFWRCRSCGMEKP